MAGRSRVGGKFAMLTVALLALPACEGFLLDDGGGGGGGGEFQFDRGFVFIRDLQVFAGNTADGYSPVGQLTREGSNRTPVISPDGNQVAFIRVAGNETELRVVPSSGGASSLVTTSAGSTRRNFRLPVFTPDGTSLVYAFDEAGRSHLAQVNTDGSNDVELTPVASDQRSYTSPSFSRSGRLLAAGGFNNQYDGLYDVDVGSGVYTPVFSFNTAGMLLNNRAVISPDGRKAAFDARVSGGISRVYVVDLMAATMTQLTDTVDADDVWPTWVGSTSVAWSSDSGGADQTYQQPADSELVSGGLEVPSAFQPFYGPN